jgi:hypothetical protein
MSTSSISTQFCECRSRAREINRITLYRTSGVGCSLSSERVNCAGLPEDGHCPKSRLLARIAIARLTVETGDEGEAILSVDIADVADPADTAYQMVSESPGVSASGPSPGRAVRYTEVTGERRRRMTTETETGEYDPESPEPPARDPPLRDTAPQSEFTPRQVALGVLVLFVGLSVIVGLTLALA